MFACGTCTLRAPEPCKIPPLALSTCTLHVTLLSTDGLTWSPAALQASAMNPATRDVRHLRFSTSSHRWEAGACWRAAQAEQLLCLPSSALPNYGEEGHIAGTAKVTSSDTCDAPFDPPLGALSEL